MTADATTAQVFSRLVSGPARTGQLARLAGVSTSFMLRRMKKLEKHGKVERHPRYTYENDISWTLPARAQN